MDIDSTIDHNINATVTAGDAPVFSGEEVVTIGVNNPFDFKSFVNATDTEDGDITDSIIATGDVDSSRHGVYNVGYTVTDSDGNTSEFSQVVVVTDGYYYIEDNYIVHKKDYTISYLDVILNKSVIIEQSEFALYTIDGVRVDDSLIEIDYNDYTNARGEYTVFFSVSDTSILDVDIPVNITVTGELNKLGYSSLTLYAVLLLLLLVLNRKIYKYLVSK